MKLLLFFILFVSALNCFGQKISGVITDKANNRPLSGAVISLGALKTYTNTYGVFEIINANGNDSLKVTHIGFKPFSLPVTKDVTVLHIEMEPLVTTLKEVTIRGKKDFKQDSINNRLDFQKQFNYKAPKLSDAINGYPNLQTGELLSVDPFTLINVLTKKSSPDYKFNKLLIKDEHEDYVTRKFNKGLVSGITGLKGDTLQEFLTRFRPTYDFVLTAADYNMEQYIRECFEKYKDEGFPVTNPFGNPLNKIEGPVKLN